MEEALRKKRQRDELWDDGFPVEDLKQGRLSIADVDCSGICSNKLPELLPVSSPDCYYYCCVLGKDLRSWDSDNGRGSGIRAMAIRKQSSMQDCFDDKRGGEEEVELDGGEVIKELWRAESPLCDGETQEPLFGDHYFGFEDHSDSAFRFWEDDDDQQNKTMHGNDPYEYKYDEELFAESLELEVCAPSL